MRFVAHAPEAPDDSTTIYVRHYQLAGGDRFGAHSHPTHQLTWSPTAALEADAGDRHWALPPSLALWIPADVVHDVSTGRPALVHNLYFAPSRSPLSWPSPTVVAVTPLVRELIVHLGTLTVSDAERRRVEGVLLDVLRPVSGAPASVPLPSDPRAAGVARQLLANPADNRTLDEWGRLAGASRRTLARLFLAETGLTFADWRTQARLRAAAVALTQGASTNATARRVGYRSVSAFTAAFHRTMGRTPGAYARDRAS